MGVLGERERPDTKIGSILQSAHNFKHNFYAYTVVQFWVAISIIWGSRKKIHIFEKHKPFQVEIGLSIQTPMLPILGHKLM